MKQRNDTRSLTRRRVDATRHDIAVAALALEREHGWDNLTVADLALAAHVSLRTFYRYFPTKADVFVPLIEEAIARMHHHLETIDTGDLPHRVAIASEQALIEFPGGLAAAHASYRTLLATPSLTAVWLMASVIAEPETARILHERFPEFDDEHEGLLLSALITTCQRIGLQDWTTGPSTQSFAQLVEHAIRRTLAVTEQVAASG